MSISASEVTFVVFTCDRHDDLGRCLQSIREQTVSGWNLLVVDNGTDEKTDAVLRSSGARVIKDRTKRLSYLFNLGWKNASRPLLAFLADDVTIESSWLAEAMATLSRNPDAAVATGPLTSPTEFTGEMHRLYSSAQGNWLFRKVVQCYDRLVMEGKMFEPGMLCDSGAYTMGQAFPPKTDEERDIDLATTSGMLIRRSAVEAIDGFDENFRFNHADGDLFVRLKKDGYRIIFNPGMRGVHYTRLGPSRYPEIIGRDTAFFYMKDIRPKTWKGRLGFIVNVTVLNTYWIYKAIQTRDIRQLKGISGFMRGISDYFKARRQPK